MIRHACKADTAQLIALFTNARDASPTWCGITECRATLLANLHHMMLSPQHLVLVLERDAEIVGVLVGATIPSWWHAGLEASDLLFYVHPDHRGRGMGLLNKFIEWARGFPTMTKIYLSVSYGGPEGQRTEAIYDKRFARIGAVYQTSEVQP